MKIQFYFLIALMAFAFASCDKGAPDSAKGGEAGKAATASTAATSFSVDAAASKLAWIGSKVTGDQHNGAVKISNGTLKAEGGNLTAGEFTIDMTSIANLDLPTEGDYNNAKLEGHLKSPDFFGVEEHPTASFVVTGVAPVADGGAITHTITGNLTIKGITKEISIPAAVTMGEGTINADANFSIDRADFDVKYGSGSFFEDLGDNMINDEVKMELSIVASANEA